MALWRTIAERNPSLTLSCIGNGTYHGCQILAEQTGFTTVTLTETEVIHCDIPIPTLDRGCAARAQGASNKTNSSRDETGGIEQPIEMLQLSAAQARFERSVGVVR